MYQVPGGVQVCGKGSEAPARRCVGAALEEDVGVPSRDYGEGWEGFMNGSPVSLNSNTCPTGGTVNPKSVPELWDSYPLRYARVPYRVLVDVRLSTGAVRVYGVMASKIYKGNKIYVGLRKLSELTGLSKSSIGRCIQELVRYEHLEVVSGKHGERRWYKATSPVFSENNASDAAARTAWSGPVKLAECQDCRNLRPMTRAGCCRGCLGKRKTEAAIEQVILANPGMSRRDAYAEVRSSSKTFRESYRRVKAKLKRVTA